MGESQIVVKCNGHYGDDLAIVNAARRSFGKKSDWEWYIADTGLIDVDLKDKDKRLLEFLARGMSTDDFEDFCDNVVELGMGVRVGEEPPEWYLHHLVDALWQWRNTPTHDTPFNHSFISFDIKVPIFVMRQLV